MKKLTVKQLVKKVNKALSMVGKNKTYKFVKEKIGDLTVYRREKIK
jgi:hypothetical protein